MVKHPPTAPGDSTATRLPLAELERRCQKLKHREIGTWMARRVSRPAALRITWLISPWGVSAHLATLSAWGVGFAAAIAFGWGSPGGWLLGAALWQLFYLLDHVDGQLARLRRTESLDGAQLDYWMHHAVHLALPCGMGFGLFASAAEPWWLIIGFAWGLALLLVGLEADTRAKAFMLRLKRLSGELRVIGGGGGRPAPAERPPRALGKLGKWALRKGLEVHVLMNIVAVLALGQCAFGDARLTSAKLFVGLAGPISVGVAIAVLAKSIRRQSAEQEFAAWFRLPRGCELAYHEGWWVVHSDDSGRIDEVGKLSPATCQQSS